MIEQYNLKQCEFDTKDGVSNLITIVEPSNSDLAYSNTVILCLPAMGMAAKQYKRLQVELSKLGFTTACYDLRGNGNSSIRANRANNFGYASLAEIDLPMAVTTLKKRFPNRKLTLLGHSLGGQISALYISQNPNTIETLILTASCSVYFKNWSWPKRWGLLVFSQFAWIISVIVGYFPGRRLGFGGQEGRDVMRDWAHNARTGDYKLNHSQYNYVPFPKVPKLDVLAINFADDDFAPTRATNHLISKLRAEKVSKELVTGQHIGQSKADHFNWLKNPSYVAQLIAKHLSK